MNEKKDSIIPAALRNGGAKKFIPIVAAVVLILGIIGMLVFSGKDVSTEGVIAIVVAVAGALGLGFGKFGSGGGSAIAGGALILAAAMMLSGCSSVQTPSPQCAQTVIRCAAEVVDQCVLEDGDDHRRRH